MIGYKNQHIEIACKLDDGNTQQYPYVVIRDTDNSIESYMALVHKFSGQYTDNNWVPTKTGYYKANYMIYSDANHTILNTNYNQGMDTIFITDQIAASSQIEAYGGGGGKSYAVYGVGKSVWTRDQRDKVIKAVTDTWEKLKKFEKEESQHYKESQEQLGKILKRVDSLMVVLNEMRGTSKEMNKDIEDVIKNLKKQRDIISTSSQINAAIDEINNLTKVVVSMIPDEKLENVYKELEGVNGSGSNTLRA